MKPTQLIVGIDPGTKIGLAVFDIEAKPLHVGTILNGGKEAVVERIIEFGTPCVVATDVAEPPELVISIASYFNAKLTAPEKDISEIEKNALTRGFDKHSPHERDAIVAVLKFLSRQTNKFRWLDRRIKEQDLAAHSSEIRAYVLMGVPAASAVEAFKRPKHTAATSFEKKAPVASGKADNQETIRALIETNAHLSSRLSILTAEKRALEKRIGQMESDTHRRLAHSKTLTSKEMEIRRLRSLLRRKEEEARAAKEAERFKNVGRDLESEDEDEGEIDLEQMIEDYRNERGELSVGG